MKHVFLISDNPDLEAVLTSSLRDTDVERMGDWSNARDALFKQRYDLVCIDYDAFKVEGLDAFILIDNILQKEQTPGCLLMSKSSERARQFIDSLTTVEEAIEFGTERPDEDILRKRLTPLLDKRPDDGVDEESSARQEIDVDLPSLSGGQLDDQTSVARLLYAISQACPTGILELETSGIKRRFPISEGELVVNSGDGFSERKTLPSAFAWSSGSYRFRESKDVRGGKTADLHRVIQRGIHKHLSQSDVMRAFMRDMKAYPLRTNLWLKRRADFDETSLAEFMRECDGETTFEQALGVFGANAVKGFKAAYYAHATDLIYLSEKPLTTNIVIHYDRDVEEVQRARSEADKKATKAYRAAGSGRADLEAELSEYLEELERATPYEIFDVWEGCGRKPVQRKFYAMVKVHHPDVYGGNVSGEIKRLAQEIFITIKDAYKELIKVEKEQTAPKPDGWDDEPDVSAPSGSRDAETTTSTSSLGERSSSVVVEPDTSTDRLRQARSKRSGHTSDDRKSGGESGGDAARKSKIERLKAKRRTTPIGMGREPSSPIEQRKKRKKTDPDERRKKMEEIKRRTNTETSRARTTSGAGDVDMSGNKPQDFFNRGYKAYRQEKWEQARQSFGKAYNEEPNNGLYMTFYAYSLFMTDSEQIDSAMKLLRKAIETGHKQALPDAHLFLGQMLKVKERTQEAVRHFKNALKLNPGSRAAQRELRLHEMRNSDKKKKKGKESAFLKNLFKK
jgi:tetratricopeptide (TPR) repeat protein/CheY-like chemotaxis protein